MSLICPFCLESFEPMDLVFCADTTSKKPFNPLNGEVDTFSRRSALPNMDGASTALGMGRSRSKAALAGDTAVTAAAEDEDEGKKSVPDVFAKPTPDIRLKRFLYDYGEGNLFRYEQTATFYRATDDGEQAAKDGEYGLVIQTEGDGIPVKINVPTRAKNPVVTMRVCPHCHCEIPVGYFATDERNKFVAALAGCSGAGKTQYITTALRELHKEMNALRLGTVKYASCSEWFLNMYVEMYKRGSLEATRKEYLLFPLMLRVESLSKGDKKEDSDATDKEGSEAFVTFYDCAGEYATNAAYAANLVGLRMADVLLLMMDPSQFWDDITVISEGERKCTNPFADSLSLIRDFELCPNLKKIVAVLTKLDTIMYDNTFLHGDSASARDGQIVHSHDMTVHKGAVNMAVMDTIHHELLAMFDEHDHPDMQNDIVRYSGVPDVDVSLLGVSTYCWEGDMLVPKPERETGRHRLIEPLLLAMTFWNILPTKREMPQEPVIIHDEPRVGFWRKLFGRA